MPGAFYTVYRVTNLINGKSYIGKHQTCNPDDGYLGSGKLILAAIKKYGRENFKKEIFYACATEAEMNALERELVTEEFCSRDDNYNLCPGGEGGWGFVNRQGMNFGHHNMTQEEIRASALNASRSVKNRRSVLNDAFVRAGKTAFKGRRHTEATKEKIRQSRLARKP